MAPKARPIDLQLVQTLLDQGHTQRQIAEQLQLPESTLRHRLRQAGLLRVHQGRQSEGVPISNPGPPEGSTREGDLGIPLAGVPESTSDTTIQIAGISAVDIGPPSEGLPEGDLGIPIGRIPEVPLGTTLKGLPDGNQGPPPIALSPQFLEDVRAIWPELQALLAWWRLRHQGGQAAQEKLTRVTYHVAPQWIDAVKREADLSGESYAAIVNRAFAQYFGQR